MVATICIAYVCWLIVGLLLPPFLSGYLPESWVSRVWNERDDSMYDGHSGYAFRWMWYWTVFLPPVAVAVVLCLGICGVIYNAVESMLKVPGSVQRLGERLKQRRIQKQLPRAVVSQITSEQRSSGR